jgi:hypothetical protein
VAWLEVVVSHGRGETVLPGGVGLQLEGEAAETLKKSGFLLPNPEGSVRPELTREETASGAKTTLKLPVVPLPSRPGRVELTLPPLPIAVARASGETFHLCTRPHTLRVEEPIANQSAPTPKGNPPPRRQLEQWLLLKYATYFALAALAIGGLLAWLILRWLARPRPTKPLPPPRPPWEVALEELHDVRFAGLVELGRPDEHYARVANTIRKYLGARFGFDGLESTTREVLGRLRHVAVAAVALPEIERFLRHADLVKFARLTPSPEECRVVLERAEDVVRKTMPLAHAPAEAVMAPSAEPPQAPVSAGRGESLPVAASEPPRTDPKQGGGAS